MVHCFLKSFLFFGCCFKEGDLVSSKLRTSSNRGQNLLDDKEQISIEWITYGAANNDDSKNARKNVSAERSWRRTIGAASSKDICYISYPALHSYLAIKLRDCMCETNAFTFFSFPEKGRGERRLPSLKPTFFMTRWWWKLLGPNLQKSACQSRKGKYLGKRGSEEVTGRYDSYANASVCVFLYKIVQT